MTESIVIQLITTAGIIVVAWLGNRKLNRIGSDAKEAREQTANSHQGAEYPNLRDEITAVHQDVRGIAGIVKGHDRRFAHIDRNLEDLHRDDNLIESTIDRESLSATRALAAAIEDRNNALAVLRQEIPDLIRTQIVHHAEACPLRQQL